MNIIYFFKKLEELFFNDDHCYIIGKDKYDEFKKHWISHISTTNYIKNKKELKP